ncbi:MAG: hypothetical protein HFF96_01280 [Oscillibacter sp.]|jgi:hypothetical protein|uniref:hypothetical protein n=1 Tax=Oscillibacter sp. TaxID=1945593 RepID=UPI002171F37E|nr:hypothetical protein [Oscillibacter sp.]MCI8841082.1 hypothetical protein [Oscillibacter sp.]MCI9112879.1 hypothetical protein [Oscillibacter sp.]
MRKRKSICIFLMFIVFVGSLTVNVGAISTGEYEFNVSMARATGRFSVDIPGNAFFTADTSFHLETEETVAINAVYSPRSASMDFGLIAPDGLFYSFRAAHGNFNKTITIGQRGSYTLAIRNNSSSDISVSGFVTY